MCSSELVVGNVFSKGSCLFFQLLKDRVTFHNPTFHAQVLADRRLGYPEPARNLGLTQVVFFDEIFY